jgi:hypothetical protein
VSSTARRSSTRDSSGNRNTSYPVSARVSHLLSGRPQLEGRASKPGLHAIARMSEASGLISDGNGGEYLGNCARSGSDSCAQSQQGWLYAYLADSGGRSCKLHH